MLLWLIAQFAGGLLLLLCAVIARDYHPNVPGSPLNGPTISDVTQPP